MAVWEASLRELFAMRNTWVKVRHLRSPMRQGPDSRLRSLGRKSTQPFQSRLRWGDVKYDPGEPASVQLSVDRNGIAADGRDLGFVTATILDSKI